MTGVLILLILAGPGTTSASHLTDGQKYFFKGKYEKALKSFEKALKKQPDHPITNYFLGTTNYELHQYNEAKQYLEKVVQLKPDYELARLQLARSCYKTGDYAWASVHLLHLKDIQTKEFKKKDFAMIQAVKEWEEKSAKSVQAAEKAKTEISQQKDLTPPEIIIMSPPKTRGLQIVSKSTGVLIKGQVKDQSPLRWVKINGENVELDDKGNFSKNYFLSIGKNAVKIVACDIFMNTSEASFQVEKKLDKEQFSWAQGAVATTAKRPEMFALIIGIGNYKDTNIPPLDYTVNDARGMYTLLTDPEHGYFKEENVRLLVDKQATTKNITKTLGIWLKESVGADDTVLLYFAGHGAPEAGNTYWVTYDSDINDLYNTGISNDKLSSLLKSIPSKTVLCFLDSCYSAATVNRGWHTRSLVEKDPFKDFKGEGRVVITSSSGKQKSLESKEHGHGVFTYYLIEGLKGKADQDNDGYIILDEVWDYVKFNVKNTASGFGYHQTPIIDGRHSAGILLSHWN